MLFSSFSNVFCYCADHTHTRCVLIAFTFLCRSVSLSRFISIGFIWRCLYQRLFVISISTFLQSLLLCLSFSWWQAQQAEPLKLRNSPIHSPFRVYAGGNTFVWGRVIVCVRLCVSVREKERNMNVVTFSYETQALRPSYSHADQTSI